MNAESISKPDPAKYDKFLYGGTHHGEKFSNSILTLCMAVGGDKCVHTLSTSNQVCSWMFCVNIWWRQGCDRTWK